MPKRLFFLKYQETAERFFLRFLVFIGCGSIQDAPLWGDVDLGDGARGGGNDIRATRRLLHRFAEPPLGGSLGGGVKPGVL